MRLFQELFQIRNADNSAERKPSATTRNRLCRWMHTRAGVLNKWAIVGIIVAVAAIGWAIPIRELGKLLQVWADRLGLWGYVVYAVAFLLMTIFSIPVWVMPFVAGAAFGTVAGTWIGSLSCTLSAAVGFLIARTLRNTWLQKRLEASPRMRALERVVKTNNWKIVVAVRLSHFLTFGMQNYAFGLTKIGFWTFTLTTWVVTLPGITLQVYLGDLGFSSLESWQEKSLGEQGWILRIAGLIAMVVAVTYLGYLGRSVYREAVAAPLDEALMSELARDRDVPRCPWASLLLCAFALMLLVTATLCVAERESLRESLEAWNSIAARQVGRCCYGVPLLWHGKNSERGLAELFPARGGTNHAFLKRTPHGDCAE